MNSREWENFGEEIRKTVQDAVEKQDYEKLNQAITETIDQAMNTLKSGVKSAKDSVMTGYAGYKTYTTDFEKAKRSDKSVQEHLSKKQYPVTMPSKVGPVLGVSLGYGLGAASSVVALLFFIAGTLAYKGFAAGFYFGAWIFGLIGVGGIAVGVVQTRTLARIRRFKNYLSVLGNKEYCNISGLAEECKRSDQAIVRDLEYMIRKKWFREGHLDRKKTCLMVTDQIYQQYRQLEEHNASQEKEAKEKEALKENQIEETKILVPEVQKIIEQGETYIRRIRACNDAIPGEEISAKISHMEQLVDKIFERVEQEPRCVSDIEKLMEYYLPTTVKLLEAYARMDAQPAGGKNIQSAKKEIEATLDTLNSAFEKLLDDLFLETAWDISSDISVLNTILMQEGLKDDGLKEKVKKGKSHERI